MKQVQMNIKHTIKEQKKIINLIKIERFYLFLYWNYAKIIGPSITPPISDRDFAYKRCIK